MDRRFNDADHDDILLARSTDGGLTWDDPVVVGSTPRGVDAFTAMVDVDGQGRVAVSYYDFRNDQAADAAAVHGSSGSHTPTTAGRRSRTESRLTPDVVRHAGRRLKRAAKLLRRRLQPASTTTGTVFHPAWSTTNPGNLVQPHRRVPPHRAEERHHRRTRPPSGRVRPATPPPHVGAAAVRPLPFYEAARNWAKHFGEDLGPVDGRGHEHHARAADPAGAPERHARPFDRTFPRYEALMPSSYSRKGALPLGKTGDRLQVHRTSVTNIDGLERPGSCTREPHERDRHTTLAASIGQRAARRRPKPLKILLQQIHFGTEPSRRRSSMPSLARYIACERMPTASSRSRGRLRSRGS